VKSQSCKSEQSIEGLLLQVCAESKGFKHLKCLKVAARSARKSLFQDSKLGNLRKDKAFEFVEGQDREAVP
jgi:hypothetical protein